ncbi:MAG: hypothetical protein ACRESS_08405 [Stenotrophobium sp.]
MTEKSTDVIPEGPFCYRVVEKLPGETFTGDSSRFGMELREWSYRGNLKEVLCPYWQRTEHGTVRCEFLGREYVEPISDEYPIALAYFGSEAAMSHLERSQLIPDEIKICGINNDDDD